MEKSFTLTLIRHGETEHNKLGIIQGQRDTSLSDKGRRQAELVGERLKSERFTHVYTSDLQRAAETCRLILLANTATKVDLMKDERLRERKLGALEGQSISESLRGKMDCDDSASEGMETKAQLRKRAIDFFQSLCKEMWLYLHTHPSTPGSPPPSTSSPNHNSSEEPDAVVSMDTQPPVSTPTVVKTTGGGSTKKRKHERRNEDGGVANHVAMETTPPDAGKSDGCHGNTVAVGSPPHSPTSSLGEGTRACWSRTGRAPNVSILPTGQPRLGRHPPPLTSPIDTTAGSSNPRKMALTAVPPSAAVLVVSHGGLLAELVSYFVEDLACRLPHGSGRRAAKRIMPNAGLSQFVIHELKLPAGGAVAASDGDWGGWRKPKIICISIHDKGHLVVNGSGGGEAAPLATSCYEAL